MRRWLIQPDPTHYINGLKWDGFWKFLETCSESNTTQYDNMREKDSLNFFLYPFERTENLQLLYLNFLERNSWIIFSCTHYGNRMVPIIVVSIGT